MKNLLLISLDTLRADVAYSGKFKNINSLRKNGVTFLNSISSSPLTPVSHSTIFTWLQPFNHWVRHLFKEQIRDDVITLAERLKDNNYETGAIVSCPGMNKWYWFSRWFNHYDDEIPKLADGTDPLLTIDVKKRWTALKRANIVSDRAFHWLDTNYSKDKPYFLFIHFFDAHWPYEAPEVFWGDNAYEEEVAFADHYLWVFLEKAKERWYLDNTTILCFSDHWEDLDWLYPNDKGWAKLWHPEEYGHGTLLYDQTQKTVLIISDEHLPTNTTLKNQVRLVDITPTVLDLLWINSNTSFDWTSLLPIINGSLDIDLPWYSETFYPEEQKEFPNIKNKKSLRLNNASKTIFNLDSDLMELYDLSSDPNEIKNLL